MIAAAARIETIAEGFVLANFDNGVHKSRDDQPVLHSRSASILTVRERRRRRLRHGGAMGESINAARVLINEPGNYLTPRVLADKAAALASVPGITAEILDEKQIEELGMGLLLGVARGSVEPPRMLVLQVLARRRAGEPDARPGRQGHHVRYRRPVAQAGRRHGADEGRHGRRRVGRRRAALDRACSSCRSARSPSCR